MHRVEDAVSVGPSRASPIKRFRLFVWISLAILGLYVFAILLGGVWPFITFPISPPVDRYGNGNWIETTYAVRQEPIGQEYIWRRSAFLSNGERGEQTWGTIIEYFDRELGRYDYFREQSYAQCDVYLPEASFIQEGEDGYVHYRHRGYEPSQQNRSEDLICLAVWVTGKNPDGTAHSFAIVLLTIRPSFLRVMDSLL